MDLPETGVLRLELAALRCSLRYSLQHRDVVTDALTLLGFCGVWPSNSFILVFAS